jgi:hypothetical protein
MDGPEALSAHGRGIELLPIHHVESELLAMDQQPYNAYCLMLLLVSVDWFS